MTHSRGRCGGLLLAVTWALFVTSSSGAAQDSAGGSNVPWGALSDPEAYPRPVAEAARTNRAPRIDGRLDDEGWTEARVLTDFIQSQPDPGALATERSEIRLLYDDEALYIGAMLFDSQAGQYVVQSLERDFPSLSTRDADILGVTLDMFLDRRNSFILLVNPYGAYRDGQTFDDSRNQDFGFDIPVEVRTAHLEEGWSAEIRIPWSGLRYDAGRVDQIIGLNFLRRVRRKNEDSYWAPVERRDPVHRMSKAGTLHGVRDLPSARNLSIKPYALAADQAGRTLAPDRRGSDADVGLDVKLGLTPGLTLDLTMNTDFSQVEVDRERVNLTRFSLFFPEQRDFFVENSGSFTFGDQTERNYRMGASLRDLTLFHSRAIGLRDGRPVPIVAGGRVSGSLGPWEVGLLDMRTGAQEGAPGENFLVMRVRREVAGGSDVGAIFIDRAAVGGSGGTGNRSFGVDANVRLFEGLILSSYLARTETAGATGDQTAARFGAAWRDRDWNISALYRRIGDDFRPGVGFVRRRDVEHLYATVGAHRRPDIAFVQELAPYVAVHRYADLDGTLVTRDLELGVRADFVSGAGLTGQVTRRFELVDEAFTVGEGVVPTGRYDFDGASMTFQSSAGRALSGDVRVGGGGYFHGHRRSVGGSLRWLASARLALTASADHNRIEFPEGSFNSSVYAGRLKYALNTSVFASLSVQYNELLNQLVTYGRFNVIHGPLSDLFLVLSERRQLGPAGGVLERTITAKVTKLLAY
jgi:hypothetical protein